MTIDQVKLHITERNFISFLKTMSQRQTQISFRQSPPGLLSFTLQKALQTEFLIHCVLNWGVAIRTDWISELQTYPTRSANSSSRTIVNFPCRSNLIMKMLQISFKFKPSPAVPSITELSLKATTRKTTKIEKTIFDIFDTRNLAQLTGIAWLSRSL